MEGPAGWTRSHRRQVATLLAGLLVVVVPAARGSDSAASRSRLSDLRPSIELVMTPTVQSLETTVVATFDPRTHERRPALRLGTASFGITLTNTRRAELTGVAVSDPLSPRCNRTIGRLAPGAAFAYACSAANVGRDYVNTATAFARSPGGSRLLARAGARGTVIATARSFVRVKKPRKKVHVPSLAFTG